MLYQWIASRQYRIYVFFGKNDTSPVLGLFVIEEQLVLCTLPCACVIRYFHQAFSTDEAFTQQKGLKDPSRIYQAFKFGPSYKNSSYATSEIVQLAVEGVDQLETYFAQYLQFFYAALAPLTLFLTLLLLVL